jgi:hypothetical protein
MLPGWQPSTTVANWESGTRNFGAADNAPDIGTGSSHKRAQRPLVTEINTPDVQPYGDRSDREFKISWSQPETLIDQTSEHTESLRGTAFIE